MCKFKKELATKYHFAEKQTVGHPVGKWTKFFVDSPTIHLRDLTVKRRNDGKILFSRVSLVNYYILY